MNKGKKNELFVHFEFEKYKPRFLGKFDADNSYSFCALVPNIEFNYFYSFNEQYIISKGDVENFNQAQQIKVEFKFQDVIFSMK